MTEAIKELPGKPSPFIQLLKEKTETKFKFAQQIADKWGKDKENIRKNAGHFRDCLGKIPPEEQAEITSPAELIKALNEVAKVTGEALFFTQGETFSLLEKGEVEIKEIYAPDRNDIHITGFLAQGTNLWDKDPSIGFHFIPGTYLLEQIISPTHTKKLATQQG